jgi:type IX secretion system PorP/SprF family membrane protein
MKNTLLFVFCFMAAIAGKSQDYQLTQFYASPLELNPGMAGTAGTNRVTVNNRFQWTALSNPFKVYSFSYDHNFNNANSGLGITASHMTVGNALNTTSASVVYSYQIHLNNNITISPGLSGGFAQNGVNYSSLIFGDQISKDGIHGTNEIIPNGSTKTYFDLSSGAVVYTNSLWFGFTASHLNRPDLSLAGGKNILPVKLSVHGGAKFIISEQRKGRDVKEHSVTPAFQYKQQGPFRQFDLGFYWNYEPVMAGLWYRGIPIPGMARSSQDALAFLIGIKVEKFMVAYSYDYTVSGLGVSKSGGSHEISIIGVFGTEKKRVRIQKRIPCPKF